MISVHHLECSRSFRILWALEELGLDYDIHYYQRLPNYSAPETLKCIHPLGKAPILTDDEQVIARVQRPAEPHVVANVLRFGVVLQEAAQREEDGSDFHARLCKRGGRRGRRPAERAPAARGRYLRSLRLAHRAALARWVARRSRADRGR